jgi:hypothetical protein
MTLNLVSIPFNPIPDILDKTPGKYSEATVLLKPTVSKLHPPLYELKTDIHIFDIIFNKP